MAPATSSAHNVGVHYKSPLRRYHSKHETEEFLPCNGFLLSLAEEPRSRKSRHSGPFCERSKGSYVQEHPQALSKSNPSKSTLKKGVDSKISHIIIPDSLSCTAVVRRRRGSR